MTKSNLFNTEALDKRLNDLKGEVKPEFVIGVDCSDERKMAFCLVRDNGKSLDIILMKTHYDKDAINEEVENLSKYFNAKVYRQP